MSADDRLHFLRTVPLFAGMDDEELLSLAQDMRQRSLAAGETLFYQGDPGNAVYIVASGTVRIYVHAEDGQELSVVLNGARDVFGEMALIDQHPRSATATAMEDTVLWVMRGEDFERHLHASHQLALNLMLTLSERVREANDKIRSLASLDVTRRIAKRLLSLAIRRGVVTERGVRIESRLTQGELASLVSSSRESANRAIRALQRQGLIEMVGGYITILKQHELSSLVGVEETWW